MLLLTSVSDKLQIITTGTANIDVHASWIDLASGTVSAGRTNTKISTAATTDVVAAPAASTTRNVKTLHINNTHASASNQVTVQHTDGTNVIVLESITLLAQERLSYVEGLGFRVYDTSAREKLSSALVQPGASSGVDQTANAADTYLAGSSFNITNRIQVGSIFRWQMRASKTAAGTATPIMNIRVGTAGALADAAVVVMTGAAQTAAADTGFFDVEAIISTAGATGVIRGVWSIGHDLAATGFAPSGRPSIVTTSAAVNLTVANSIIGLSCNPGALGVWTFQTVTLECINLLA